MAKLTCYKIKGGKQTKIPNKVCLSKKSIDKYLNEGYTITKVVDTKTVRGEKTTIHSFSPLTRAEALIPDYDKWYGKIVYELEGALSVTTSDAQGIIDAQPFYLRQSWSKGLSAKETAKVIDKASRR